MIKCTELEYNPHVNLYENTGKVILINESRITLIRNSDIQFNDQNIYKIRISNYEYYITVISEDIDKMFKTQEIK